MKKSEMMSRPEGMASMGQPLGNSIYEFLATGAALAANRVPDASGWIELPIEELKGQNSVTAIVVHPNGISSKFIPLPTAEISKGDLRLAKAFSIDRHLAQRQEARILEAGVEPISGMLDRLAFKSIQPSAMSFDSTQHSCKVRILEKFKKIARWHLLNDAEKRSAYNELACHELHLFLYMKDRPFFDKVVRPYLDNKYATQLLDGWLLNDPSRSIATCGNAVD